MALPSPLLGFREAIYISETLTGLQNSLKSLSGKERSDLW
jgi:hypothetical protein